MVDRAASPRASRPLHVRVRDRVRTADPALARARTAVRALVSAALAGGTTLVVLQALGRETTPVGLAVLVGLFGVVIVPPGPPRAFVPVVGGAGALGATLAAVAGPGLLGWTFAFAATVAGAWLGRWGPVGRGAGFVGFLSTVIGLRLVLVPADAPGAVLAVLVACVAVVVTVRVLVRDNAAGRAVRLGRDLRAQVSLLLDAGERLVGDGPGDRRQRRLRLRLVAAQETATLLDQTLEEVAPGVAAEAVAETRRALLDVEALADHVAWSALTVPAATSRRDRGALVEVLRQGRVDAQWLDVVGEPLVPRLTGYDDRLGEIVPRLGAAARRLRVAADGLTHTGTAGVGWGVPAPVPVGRVVVQAAAAGALALVLGLLVSPEEWYWSLIGAYVVVTTTSSRGAGVRKAGERIVGTAVGVVTGLGAVALLGANAPLLVALVVLVAAMVWLFQRSYVLFMFALTVVVALLYEVLGILTPQVLALRFAETALGASVAAVVVSVVLPVSSGRTVDGAVQAVLASLEEALDELAAHGRVTTAQVRAVDRAITALREVAAPLAVGVPGGGGPRIRAARLLATALRVRVTALATATAGRDGLAPPERAALVVVRERLALLRAQLLGHGLPPDEHEPFPPGEGDLHDVLRALDDRLAGYGTSRGITLRHDPGALAAGSGARLD